MSLRDMVRSYSSEPATATPATSATHGGLAVARVATVAVASGPNDKERLTKRWRWFLSLAVKHGVHPDVVGAEFPSDAGRLDVIEPLDHDDNTLRCCMETLCKDVRVEQRQIDYEAGQWLPIDYGVALGMSRGTVEIHKRFRSRDRARGDR